MYHRILQALGLLAIAETAFAQAAPTAASPLSAALSVHTGTIIPHSRKLINVSGSRPYGAQVDLFWTLAEERHTRRTGLIARRGAALQVVDFDDPHVLGRAITLVPFVEPMIRGQQRLHGSVRLGAGFAWLNKVYDPVNNPTNLFFSTRFSFTGSVAARLGYRLTPKWELTVGYSFNHISNGGMKEPNKGMNFPTWNGGLIYTPRPAPLARPVRDGSWREQPRCSALVQMSGTLKSAVSTDGSEAVRTVLAGATALGTWRVGRLSALSAGFEVVHDGFARELMDRSGETRSAWKAAVIAGPELVIGRVRFGILFGAYVHNPSRTVESPGLKPTDPVYQRYLLQYRCGKHLVLGYSLKAHRHVADTFDLRLGWTW